MQAIHVCNHTTPEALYPFDARGIAKRFRHAAIFGALDALQPGETMRFCNDHDPLPLLAQLQARYGEQLEHRIQAARAGRHRDRLRRRQLIAADREPDPSCLAGQRRPGAERGRFAAGGGASGVRRRRRAADFRGHESFRAGADTHRRSRESDHAIAGRRATGRAGGRRRHAGAGCLTGCLYPAAAVDLVLAAILLNWIAARARAALGSPHPGWRWYGAALGCLMLALLSALLIPLWPQYWKALRIFHLHLNTLGLIGLAALGTLPVLLPTALGKPDPEAASWLRRRLWLVAGGALVVATGAAVIWPFAARRAQRWCWLPHSAWSASGADVSASGPCSPTGLPRRCWRRWQVCC